MQSNPSKYIKHVFIEKPVTKSIEEGNELLRLSKINNVKVQIGHISRLTQLLFLKNSAKLKPYIETLKLLTRTVNMELALYGRPSCFIELVDS